MRAYTGGKASPGIYQTIINQMPPHTCYVEAFLGAGAVLRHKRPAAASIAIDRDADVLAERWKGDEVPGLTLMCGDALEILAGREWQGNELVYLDPPYPMATRRSRRRYYRHELSDEDHARLLQIVTALPVPTLISSYWSRLYGEALAGWRSITFPGRNRRNEPATEWLWMNYPEPETLHDYQYLGTTYRERERIKRQQKTWRDRLVRMSVLQRQALLSAIDDLGISHR